MSKSSIWNNTLATKCLIEEKEKTLKGGGVCGEGWYRVRSAPEKQHPLGAEKKVYPKRKEKSNDRKGQQLLNISQSTGRHPNTYAKKEKGKQPSKTATNLPDVEEKKNSGHPTLRCKEKKNQGKKRAD